MQKFLLISVTLAALAILGASQQTPAPTDSKMTKAVKKLLTPVQMQIIKHIDSQRKALNTMLGMDPESKFMDLFPEIKTFNLSQIKECYDSSMGDDEFNIFENSVYVTIQTFYKHFSDNFEITKFPIKVKNLFGSLNSIAKQTTACLLKPSSYKLGLTSLSDWSDSEYKGLLGAKFEEEENNTLWPRYLHRLDESEGETNQNSQRNNTTDKPKIIELIDKVNPLNLITKKTNDKDEKNNQENRNNQQNRPNQNRNQENRNQENRDQDNRNNQQNKPNQNQNQQNRNQENRDQENRNNQQNRPNQNQNQQNRNQENRDQENRNNQQNRPNQNRNQENRNQENKDQDNRNNQQNKPNQNQNQQNRNNQENRDQNNRNNQENRPNQNQNQQNRNNQENRDQNNRNNQENRPNQNQNQQNRNNQENRDQNNRNNQQNKPNQNQNQQNRNQENRDQENRNNQQNRPNQNQNQQNRNNQENRDQNNRNNQENRPNQNQNQQNRNNQENRDQDNRNNQQNRSNQNQNQQNRNQENRDQQNRNNQNFDNNRNIQNVLNRNNAFISEDSSVSQPNQNTNNRSSEEQNRSNSDRQFDSNRSLNRLKRETKEVASICKVKNRSPLPAKFDWRTKKKVTPVRYQGSCGSCWAFAALASLESAYLIKGKTNDQQLDLSEQELLSCARENGCKGGTAVDAFNFILKNKGVSDESSIPYDFQAKRCLTRPKKIAKIKDYCLRGVYVTNNGKKENLNDQEIQYIIREFGPVYATINADDVVVKNLKSGIYSNPNCSKQTNHAITIVGWDEKAWIIKNSWGKSWGNEGYFRMKRGENMCGLNTYIMFPIV